MTLILGLAYFVDVFVGMFLVHREYYKTDIKGGIYFDNDKRYADFIKQHYNPIEIAILAFMVIENLLKLVYAMKNPLVRKVSFLDIRTSNKYIIVIIAYWTTRCLSGLCDDFDGHRSPDYWSFFRNTNICWIFTSQMHIEITICLSTTLCPLLKKSNKNSPKCSLEVLSECDATGWSRNNAPEIL